MSTFAELTTKKARIAFIKEKLQSNQTWAIKGLLRIYDNQTDDEQRSETTRHWNAIGFSGCDAEILSSFAKQIRGGRTMSDKQMKLIFKKVPKYARQLNDIATAEAK